MPKRTGQGTRLGNDKQLLVGKAAEYLRYKKDESMSKKRKDALKPDITRLLRGVTEDKRNEKGHLEIELPMGDGINEIFIQLQNRVSVGMVDNALELLEEKLGADAIEPYVVTTKRLHPNALEQLSMKGIISDADLLDLTKEKTSEALIIKPNKRKTK